MSRSLGTTLGKVKENGDVYYINIRYMDVEDVFNDDLVHSTGMWRHIDDYKFCPVGDFFSSEKFKEDKTLWRILVDIDGSIKIRQDELTGAPKPDILTTPLAESLDISGIPNITVDSIVLNIPPSTVHSITLDVLPSILETPTNGVPEIPTFIPVRRSFWSRFLCAGTNVA